MWHGNARRAPYVSVVDDVNTGRGLYAYDSAAQPGG